MTRKTSAETYYKVLESGLLSKIRLEIYNALYENGAMTALETFKVIFPSDSDGQKIQSYFPRFAELKRMGLIEECGERHCNISGNNKIVWQTTDSLGSKLPKRLSKSEKKKEIESLIIGLAHNCSEVQKESLRVILKKIRKI